LNIIQVVFEKGVTVQLSTKELWQFHPFRDLLTKITIQIKDIANDYNVRPILITDQLAPSRTRTYLLPINLGTGILEMDLSQITSNRWENDAMLHSVFNVHYIVGATIYHCKRLAKIYSQICNTFANLPIQVKSDSDKMTFGNFPEPYYEFDALITAARRAYDSTRYILWRVFCPGSGSVPSSFKRTLPQCKNLPSSLATRLETSWSEYGMKLTDYRNCIQHYVPLDYGITSAHMSRIDERLWSTTMLIPDNPEVKSTAKLRYKTKIDALTYGWMITNEIVDISTEIINAIPK